MYALRLKRPSKLRPQMEIGLSPRPELPSMARHNASMVAAKSPYPSQSKLLVDGVNSSFM